MSDAKIEVVDVPDRSRFEVLVDGELAGLADYTVADGVITFTHTEVHDGHEGQGLGSQLARTGLDSARDRGLTVIPRCSYIAGWIKKHPDFVDLVSELHRDLVS